MKKQVIVSIDPFNIQREVVTYAEELARAAGLQLLIYSVQGAPILVEPDGDFSLMAETLPGHIEEAEEAARQFYEEVKLRYPDTVFEHDVGFTTTSVVHKIKALADEEGGRSQSMLVMAHTNSHTWWNKVFGTVETTVAAQVPCPVLLVPEDAAFQGISRILYLADMQAVGNHEYPGFNFLRAFADTFNARLAVGFVCDPLKLNENGTSLSEAMKLLKASLPFPFTEEYRFFPQFSAEEILQIAELNHTDIVAFPFRKSNLFDRLFENEITRALVLKATTPVLVF